MACHPPGTTLGVVSKSGVSAVMKVTWRDVFVLSSQLHDNRVQGSTAGCARLYAEAAGALLVETRLDIFVSFTCCLH